MFIYKRKCSCIMMQLSKKNTATADLLNYMVVLQYAINIYSVGIMLISPTNYTYAWQTE